jgi:hypothetical protein
MERTPFTTLIFRGPRFTEAAMPVEALPELAAYRELLLAVAKSLYQRDNPTRQRLPKGFEASFRLVLDKVGSGSAVPNVARVVAPDEESTAFGPVDYFERARDLVQLAIAAANSDGVFPTEITPDSLARFGAFGRTLGDDDSIIVAPPGQRDGARYDKQVRRKLVLLASKTYEDNVSLIGEVRAADKDTEGFALRTPDGRKIEVRTSSIFFRLALQSLHESALVRVRGTGLYDQDGTLQKITRVTDVGLAEDDDEPRTRPGCPTQVEAQVRSLAGLPPGWFDRESPSFNPDQLEWLSKLLRGLLDGFDLPTPYVYPTPDGDARLEWSAPRWEVITTINLGSKTADVHATRIDSEEVHELPIGLQEPGAESRLGRFLGKHIEATA